MRHTYRPFKSPEEALSWLKDAAETMEPHEVAVATREAVDCMSQKITNVSSQILSERSLVDGSKEQLQEDISDLESTRSRLVQQRKYFAALHTIAQGCRSREELAERIVNVYEPLCEPVTA